MGYLGTPPQSGFITTAKQRVTSSTNDYVDLDHSISSIADVIVFVNFVKQDTTNLTLTTSTRITLGGTLVSSDIVEIHYLGKAVNTQTPATGTVTNDMLAGSIANSKLANSSITLNGSAVSLGGSATVGGDNKSAFQAYLSSSQSISDSTWTKVQFNTEQFDTNNDYDNSSNYRFTPSVAGKYYIYSAIKPETGANDNNIDMVQLKIRRNGVDFSGMLFDFRTDSDGRKFVVTSSNVMDMNGSSDYAEVYGYLKCGTGTRIFAGGQDVSYFGGFKIIT